MESRIDISAVCNSLIDNKYRLTYASIKQISQKVG